MTVFDRAKFAAPSDPASQPAANDEAENHHTDPRASKWGWVPIRSLGPRHRERIIAHLRALDANGRYLRFGYSATDAQLSKYVDMLDFEHDEIFGIFNRRVELIGMAHLAHAVATEKDGPAAAEFGVSVLAHARNRGFGRRLFEHAMLHARNRGTEILLIHALSENVAMLKIARNAGATVVREGSEADAWLKLPPDTFASHVDELFEHQAAELDYRLKVHARQAADILDAVGTVKAALNNDAHAAEE
jgi:GNAT superfamily N-acetyltransferase